MMVQPRLLLSLLVFTLCLEATTEPLGDVEYLFDKDEATVWQGSDRLSSVVFAPGKCFDSVRLLSTGDNQRNVAGAFVHVKTPDGWVLIHQQTLDCTKGATVQVIELEDEVCPESLVRLKLFSCSELPPALTEMEVGHRSTTKRAIQQVACSSIADCAGDFIGRTDCDAGFCSYPACFIDADCVAPTAPTCVNRDPAAPGGGKPICGAGCHLDPISGDALGVENQRQANFRCAHLDGFPYCDLLNAGTTQGHCLASSSPAVGIPDAPPICQVDTDCIDPDYPVCNLTLNVCANATLGTGIGCQSNHDCWHFFTRLWCNQTSGVCIQPQCLENDDCPYTTGYCDLTSAPTPFCTGCRDDDDCSQFSFRRECDAVGDGQCHYPECRNDADCLSTYAGHCVDSNSSSLSDCVPCDAHDQCAHFSLSYLCHDAVCQTPGNNVLPHPFGSSETCMENDDCPYDEPVCDTVVGHCGDCSVDMDCTQYETRPRCNVTSGECVGVLCEENEDCPAAQPICNQTDYTCVASCNNHQQCHHFFSATVCNDITGACVEPDCLEDSECTSLNGYFQVCNFDPESTTHAGVPECVDGDCYSHDDCAKFARHTWCHLYDNICIVPSCTHDSQCPSPSAPVCTYPLERGSDGAPGCDDCYDNDDCSLFFTETYCNAYGACAEPACNTFDDCNIDPEEPHCTWPDDGSPPSCEAGCSSHTECTQFERHIFCEDDYYYNVCIIPRCIEHDDCEDPTEPFCTFPGDTVSVPECVPKCTTHDHCAHFASHTYCVTLSTDPRNGTCIIPDCVEHTDCTEPGAPYCSFYNISDGRPPTCDATCHLYPNVPGRTNDVCHHFQSFTERPGMANFGPVWCVRDALAANFGGCVVPDCLEHDDCMSPAAPHCAVDPLVGFPKCQHIPMCSADNSDCAHFYAETWCSRNATTRGHCIDPVCLINEDCTNPLFPVCNRKLNNLDPVCTAGTTGCKNDNDCAHFVHEWFCVVNINDTTHGLGTCWDVCEDNFDCLNPLMPVCYSPNVTISSQSYKTTPACANQCKNNNDCAQFVQRWWCNATNGVCIAPECTPGHTDECNDPTKPLCAIVSGIPKCAPATGCANDNVCSRYAEADYCNPSTGACYNPQAIVNGCREIEDCMNITRPVCVRPTSGGKVPQCTNDCQSNDDCAHFTQITFVGQEHFCVLTNASGDKGQCSPMGSIGSCGENDDCVDPSMPICNTTMVPPMCVKGCASHDHCAHFVANVFCVNTTSVDKGKCVIPQCLEDLHCHSPSAAHCSMTGLTDRPGCVSCTKHDHCAHLANSFCLPDNATDPSATAKGTCVTAQCEEDDDCLEPGFPICDRYTVTRDPGTGNSVVTGDKFANRRRQCVAGCASNDVCSKHYYHVWCNYTAGICFDPACVDHSECQDPAKPMCYTQASSGLNLAEPYCGIGCVHNDNCTKFWQESWCVVSPTNSPNKGKCWTPGCLEDEDCTNPAAPVCVFPSVENGMEVPACRPKCIAHDNCTSFANERWCVRTPGHQKLGQCIAPVCWENSDCLNPSFPVCNDAVDPPRCDNLCTHHNNCSHYAEHTWCHVRDMSMPGSGKCIKPVCRENDDCTDPLFPTCLLNEVVPRCAARCMSDDDCTQFAEEIRCDLSLNVCKKTECFLDSHCSTNILMPACYVPSSLPAHPRGWCVECLVDAHCRKRGKEGEELYACHTADHTCVQCNRDDDCKLEGARACAVADHICVECINNADCNKGDERTCDPFSNTCVRCLNDDACEKNAPACLAGAQTCVQCLSNAHCATFPGVPACQLATHTCVECVIDNDCPGTTTCDTSRNVCVNCLFDGDCFFPTPACSVATQNCVQCTSNAHCRNIPDTPACNMATNSCVQCTADDHCPFGCDLSRHQCIDCTIDADCTTAAAPACDRSSGSCVACLFSSHCKVNTKPACDTASRGCVECNIDSDCRNTTMKACDVASHTCAQCTTNGHCPRGSVCDTANRTCAQCVFDFHCANDTVCDRSDGAGSCVECLVDDHCIDPTHPICDNTTTCVQCLTSGDCWIQDPSNPICDDGECRGCDDNSECEDQFLAFQGCDAESGTCIADSYNKGFYVAAVVLGSIAVFLVILVLILLAAGVGK